MAKKKYSEKLRDPRWQKKRLEIMERDGWCCRGCGDETSMLAVHHKRYFSGREPWDYPDKLLITLCPECHEYERTERGGIEEDLINVLRENFLCGELETIISGFVGLQPLDYGPVVIADIISWALSKNLESIKRDYFKNIKEKGKHGNS